MPILTGTARDWRTSFLVEYFSDTVFPRMRTMGYSAVRTDRYKYIEYRELQGMDELDLEADPFEMTNLIARAEAAPVLQQMRAELQRLLDATGGSALTRADSAALSPDRSAGRSSSTPR